MKFYLKSNCPVCGKENTTDRVCFAYHGDTSISADFECVGGCKTDYTIKATGKTANTLMKRMETTMED